MWGEGGNGKTEKRGWKVRGRKRGRAIILTQLEFRGKEHFHF